MKKQFEEPILEIIQFSSEDIMSTSTAVLKDNLGLIDWADEGEQE